ncbi:MAG: polyphosphate kinase 1 [Gemmatimonadota bacterium]
MSRRLNLPVDDEQLLERLATAPRPLGMSGGTPHYQLLRETFFDTADGLLRDRRMTLRTRLQADGRLTVELSKVTGVNLQGIVEETVLEEPAVGGGLYATLAGSSELSTLVREVTDPVALRPVVALDIDREIRELKRRWLGRPLHRVTFDRILTHRPGLTRAVNEISLTELGPGRPTLEALADRLRAEHGVSNDGMDTLERVRSVLDESASPKPAETPREVRVAMLLLRGGSVALTEGSGGLALPTARGAGEDLAREYLGELLSAPEPEADLELIGFAPSKGGHSDLEVWLHEAPAGTDDAKEELLWIPLVELMRLQLLREVPFGCGTPVLLPVMPHPPGVALGRAREDFGNKELSTLDFNLRVLEMAEDPSVPLLERFFFLSVFSSNMDEFFVVRVARLKAELQQASEGDEAELDAERLLDMIAIRVRALAARQYGCLRDMLLPLLHECGIRVRRWDELDAGSQAALAEKFEQEIFPVLTPLAMSPSPGHPFPRLESLGLSLAVVLRDPEAHRVHMSHILISKDLPRFVQVPDTRDLIPMEDVVTANAQAFFPAWDLQEVHAFRVSRVAAVAIDESPESFLEAVEDEVESRPYQPVIRIEVQHSMPRELRANILRQLRSEPGTGTVMLSRVDVFEVDGLIDLRCLGEIASLDLPDERFPPPRNRDPFAEEPSILDTLRDRDVLVHHPYDGFDGTVGRFLAEAAADPDVVSIKLTLYRTGRDSPVMDALLEALDRGKDVSVFVELKARFDEESNISWTHRLSEAGAHVVYGLVGFKTHAKTALVVRREEGGVRRYVHIGTGNFNSTTARFYTDLGLMSADPDLGADLNDFFNELTGSAGPPEKEHRRLWVAPTSLARGIVRCIEREIEHARAGRPARIQVKMNGLTDRKVARAMYRAAQEGVEIDLIIRGICTLRPGVTGLSTGIRVRSILGRYLEHARIYYFENAGQGEYYIGSADWRKRNLRKRVEVVGPVDDPVARDRLRSILDAELADPRAWVLRPDGAYERLSGEGPTAQEVFQS